jgi:hypothetical protein
MIDQTTGDRVGWRLAEHTRNYSAQRLGFTFCFPSPKKGRIARADQAGDFNSLQCRDIVRRRKSLPFPTGFEPMCIAAQIPMKPASVVFTSRCRLAHASFASQSGEKKLMRTKSCEYQRFSPIRRYIVGGLSSAMDLMPGGRRDFRRSEPQRTKKLRISIAYTKSNMPPLILMSKPARAPSLWASTAKAV